MHESLSGSLFLGIDPGLRVTGFGLIRSSGHSLQHVRHGAIRTESGDRPARLLEIHRAICRLLAEHQVEEVAVEKQFVAMNVSTAFVIGEVRAAAILAAVSNDVPVFEYSPTEVKQAITSYGRSSKEQVQEMVRIHFGLDSAPQPADAADALAIAICHAARRGQPAVATESRRAFSGRGR
jgi:crossover junction endodeoxyribonuclease RuvC